MPTPSSETIVQHTPGPWRAVVGPKSEQPQTLYWGLVAIIERSPDEYVSVVTDGSHVVEPEQYAPNARLIAAAPRLLDMLKGVLSNADYAIDVSLLRDAQAAIAQAEGREQ